MSELKQQNKHPRPGFGNVDHRILRDYKHVESLKEMRTRAFDDNRDVDVSVASPQSAEAVPKMNRRTRRLLKWKEERKRRKKLENEDSIVHHALCSANCVRTNAPTLVAKTSNHTTHSNDVQKRITKATEKRLLAKTAKQSAKQSAATIKNVGLTSTKHPMNIKKPTSNTKKQKSFAPANYEFKPLSGLHKMPLFGLVPIEQTPQEKGDFFIQDKSTECKTIYINEQKDISSQKLYSEIPDTSGTTKFKTYASPKLSPNKRNSSQRLNESICDPNDVTFESNRIVTTRSSFKEQTIQDSLQNKSLDNTNMKTPSQKSTPSDTSSGTSALEEKYIMENVEYTYHYFKLLWNKETKRLKELCRKWEDIQLEKDIPDDAMYEIHQTLEQTKLLINKKLERFRSLVEDCKIGRKRNWRGEQIVTCSYLQGFWDMVYMEVRNCDSRFEKLEQCRNKGWKEENLTAFRRKMIESKILNEEDMLLQDTNINVKDSTSPQNNRGSVIFDNNTDTQCSTRKSNSHDLTYKRKSTSTRRESSKTSLVQEVQFSNKKNI